MDSKREYVRCPALQKMCRLCFIQLWHTDSIAQTGSLPIATPGGIDVNFSQSA